MPVLPPRGALVAAALLAPGLAHAQQAPAACPMVLDFDFDALGQPIAAGANVSDAYAAWGIDVVVWNTLAMDTPGFPAAFDSSNPTGGDFDLGTPNADFGGPGIGAGGGFGEPGFNGASLGNLLIAAENTVDADGDGLLDSPDDNAGGAWFELFFDQPSCVFGTTVIDVDFGEARPDVFHYDAGNNVVLQVSLDRTGDNGVHTANWQICGVDHVMLDLYGSGAFDNIQVCTGGSDEVCDGVDNDGDGLVDEDSNDWDQDGFADCTDCNDYNPFVFPGATELCNSQDDDCDGAVDESFDADGDGVSTCDGDCDDTDPQANPNLTEICDGADNDCDGAVDEGFDADGDGFTTCGGDCDDADPAINPGATEACNGIDDDCDGVVDEGFDADGDGVTTCGGDCDDADPTTYPGAPEDCDGNDNDCDGVVPDDEIDADGDGQAPCGGDCVEGDDDIYTGAPEFCDNVDTDCDGAADNGFDLDGDGIPDCIDSCPMVVDVDNDPWGNAIAPGDDITDAYASWGITVAQYEDPAMALPLPVFAFDSSDPGACVELGTPNETFAGPGIGDGGEAGQPGENADALGNVVATAEGNTWYIIEFTSATCVHSVDLVDIDEDELAAQVILFDVNVQTLDTVTATGLGDNSVEQLDLGGTCGVYVMMLDAYGKAAWDNLTVCVDPDGEEEVCGDGVDNDGDGQTDEDCGDDGGQPTGGPSTPDDDAPAAVAEALPDAPSGCQSSVVRGSGSSVLIVLLSLVALRRRL